jgi:hypothetical protein
MRDARYNVEFEGNMDGLRRALWQAKHDPDFHKMEA